MISSEVRAQMQQFELKSSSAVPSEMNAKLGQLYHIHVGGSVKESWKTGESHVLSGKSESSKALIEDPSASEQ